MIRRGALLSAVLLGALAPAAAAQVAPYDGQNPFDCVLQQAGDGVAFEDPGADPFCVEYDKTHQNVSEGGVVAFLALEPARVAAASGKCFYYQRDHWRGSIVQEDGRTQTYAWDGSYWFDKSKGAGGAYVENFSLNGQTGDPTTFPGFPEEWRPFFGPGRGGVQANSAVRADPRCAEKPRDAPPPYPYRCHDRTGEIGRGIGGVLLGMTRSRLEQELGPAPRRHRGFSRYCLMQGGKLAAGLSRDRVLFVLTTSPRFSWRGASVGSPRTSLRGERMIARRGGYRVYRSAAGRGVSVIAGVRGGRVRYLAVAPSRLSPRAVGAYLARSR